MLLFQFRIANMDLEGVLIWYGHKMIADKVISFALLIRKKNLKDKILTFRSQQVSKSSFLLLQEEAWRIRRNVWSCGFNIAVAVGDLAD